MQILGFLCGGTHWSHGGLCIRNCFSQNWIFIGASYNDYFSIGTIEWLPICIKLNTTSTIPVTPEDVLVSAYAMFAIKLLGLSNWIVGWARHCLTLVYVLVFGTRLKPVSGYIMRNKLNYS